MEMASSNARKQAIRKASSQVKSGSAFLRPASAKRAASGTVRSKKK